ncbi:MAG: helix-turn-helix transcriptional regulator [Candidatus Muiribacteriota bacterium]|jgi:putative transcriptional regulator
MNIKQIFSSNLKNFRKQNKITQEELGEKLGLHPKYISELERGLKQPRFDVIEKIADILHIKPEMLFQNENISYNDFEKIKILLETLDDTQFKTVYEMIKLLKNNKSN